MGRTLRDGTTIEYTRDALDRAVKTSALMEGELAETPTVRETVYTRTGLKKRETLWEKSTARFFSGMAFARAAFRPLESEYSYDARGLLAVQRDPGGVRKEFSYDANGSRSSFKLFRDDSIEPEIDLCYTCDDNSRLAQLTSGGTQLAAYTYDANGRKLTQTCANGTVSAYTCNHAGLVARLEHKLGERVLSAWDHTYRLDGIQTSKTDKDGLKTSYTYDLVGRLTQERTSTSAEVNGETVVTFTGTTAYAYDQYGNRASVAATGFPVYTESCSYDAANRLTGRTRTQDGETTTTVNSYGLNGNLIRSVKGEGASAEITTRSYNGFGQQVSCITPDKELWFRCRPDGLRHSKQVLAGSGASQTCVVTTHLWDGQDIVAEVSTNGTTGAAYLRGNGELVAEQIGASLSCYLHNAHGDVALRTDASGGVLKSYDYDSFGNILNPATVGDPQTPIYTDQSPFGCCGEYLDKETGEIYLRARYYDPTSGIFEAEDPKRDGLNRYAY